MKILHVITSLQTGGAEKLMVDLLPRFQAMGHDVSLAVFDGRRTTFMEQLEAQRVRIISFMPKGGNVYHPRNLLKLIRLLRREKPDIVHTHNTAPQLFGAISSLFSSAKFVTTEHSTYNRRRAWKGYMVVDRWMYNRYNKVICITQKAEENLRIYLGKMKTDICTINNGIVVEKYATALPSDELDIIAPNSKKIIMVAAFRWEKDQDTLIRSLNYLPSDFHLFLVGDGSRRAELENLSRIEDMNRVNFLGSRTDVPELLHAADYVVMSSHFEGLSLSSVEGMSVGKPFLASDVDGLREVVNGAGILFPHQDAETLAKEILSLEESPEKYKSVATSCRHRANQFDISLMVNAYNDSYLIL